MYSGNILIQIKNLEFSYPELEETLLKDINMSLYSGEKIGLVGINGNGKSTLLDLIYGEKKPESGEIVRRTNSIFYLKQEDYSSSDLDVLSYLLKSDNEIFNIYKKIKEIEEKKDFENPDYPEIIGMFEEIGGFRKIKRIEEVVTAFGFELEILKRKVNTLSGGEKRILKLISGFIDEFELYLLDEPTNYLDHRGIKYLIESIRDSDSCFFIVSHNRWFLDQVVERIIEIEENKIKEWKGNYSVFIELKKKDIEEKLFKKEKIEKEIKHLRDIARNYEIWGRRKEKEKIGASDSGFISHRAAKLMKRTKIARERIEDKINELEKTIPYIEKFYDFWFEENKKENGVCITLKDISKSYGKKNVLRKFSLVINWSERIAITGLNGSGKSTLIKIMSGNERYDEGEIIITRKVKIGYLPQEIESLEEDLFVYEMFEKDELLNAQTLAGCLKVTGDNFFKKFNELSEGQKRKILIVKLILLRPNVLILDEPTTHLDYVSIEKFEDALRKFDGTIILVSHDKILLNRIAERTISL